MKNLHAPPSTDVYNEDGTLDRVTSLAFRLEAKIKEEPIKAKQLKRYADAIHISAHSFTAGEFDSALYFLIDNKRAFCVNKIWYPRKTEKKL